MIGIRIFVNFLFFFLRLLICLFICFFTSSDLSSVYIKVYTGIVFTRSTIFCDPCFFFDIFADLFIYLLPYVERSIYIYIKVYIHTVIVFTRRAVFCDPCVRVLFTEHRVAGWERRGGHVCPQSPARACYSVQSSDAIFQPLALHLHGRDLHRDQPVPVARRLRQGQSVSQ